VERHIALRQWTGAFVILEPVDFDLIPLVGGWLADEDNHQWLDFGAGTRVLSPGLLRVLTKRDSHCLRVFTGDDDMTPIGVVAFGNIDPEFHTAMLWYVLGDKREGGKGLTTRAVAQFLELGFGALNLRAINAWAVEENTPSIRVLERNGFRAAGRQRQCHYLKGRAVDRLLFDLLLSEFQESRNVRARAAQ
jgi:RimJ/RimL family protein N-acetyltransferase